VRKTAVAQDLLTLRSVVVSGHKGRDVEVDTDPRCQHCGKKLGEYFALPYSIKCRNCGEQVRRG
jgi:DNA-directed RNA polymerase subunit RPC12/RpoP